jgi:hypothetical protein
VNAAAVVTAEGIFGGYVRTNKRSSVELCKSHSFAQGAVPVVRGNAEKFAGFGYEQTSTTVELRKIHSFAQGAFPVVQLYVATLKRSLGSFPFLSCGCALRNKYCSHAA